MQFDVTQWLGAWDNFETYIESEDSCMMQAWQEAEEACKRIPGPMFAQGARNFWRRACRTVASENPARLAGWEIRTAGEGMAIRWLADAGENLGEYVYELEQIVPKGLEGKENFLFLAKDAEAGCPFRSLLAMAPMPERLAYKNGGFLSHLHYQFAASGELLLREGKLTEPTWYATMCAADGSLLDRCNVVRGLHRLPLWEKLPDDAACLSK